MGRKCAAHGLELLDVQAGLVAEGLERNRHGLGCGLAGAFREGRGAGVDDVSARLNRLEVGHLRDTRRAVRVHLQG